MKSLVCLILMILPMAANANYCESSNKLLKQWREQKNWEGGVIRPSRSNPHIQFDVLVDTQLKTHLPSFTINDTYHGNLEVEINSKYKREQYLEMCRDDYKGGRYLTAARKSADNSNSFRIQMDYLPSVQDLKNNPYQDQDLKTSSTGLGVRVILKEGSMVHRNTYFPASTQNVKKEIEAKINESLKSQLAQNVTGSLVINMDHMDDFVCDLMKGEAQLEFFHFSDMKNPLVKMISEVNPSDVKTLYSEIKKETSDLKTASENMYFSGSTAEKLSQYGEIKIEDKKQTYKIVSQFFTNDMLKIKPLVDSQITCLAENFSEFGQGQAQNSVILNVMTQHVQELMEK